MTAIYLDTITNEIHELGWSYGHVGYLTAGRPMWRADAHKDGRRCVVVADTLQTAYVELRAAVGRTEALLT